jgi:hypothetical protein
LILLASIVGMNLLAFSLTIYPQKTGHSQPIKPIPIPASISTPKNLPVARKLPLKWTPETSRIWVRRQAVSRYGRAGWRCVHLIVFYESRWRHQADNPISTAYGLFQILDTNPAHGVPTQWKRFKKYVNHKFDGDPCKAWYVRQKVGTY